MPIIRSTYNGVEATQFDNLPGGKRRYTHIQRVDEVALHCKELRKDEKKGWTKGRTMQHIARIPALVFSAHPEFVDSRTGRMDGKAISKFLRSPEGEIFRATEARI